MSATTAPHPAAAYHQRRRVEKDEKILSTARELLTEHGLAKFTIERVAWVSGVAKTTIYRRYGNALHLAAATLPYTETELASDVAELASVAVGFAASNAAAEVLLALAAEKLESERKGR